METKQGYFDPKMPYPLDRRYFKATSTEILAIPEKARVLGMEIFAYTEGQWYQFKNGITDGDLVVSDRGGGGGGGPAIENRYADITAMLVDQASQSSGGLQFVLDASADPLIDSGYAYYDYLGSIIGDLTDYRLQSAFISDGGGGLVRQIVTVIDANATDPLILDADTNTVKIILDAALTTDWQPSSITGWVEGQTYLFEIIKQSNNGIDMSVARTALNVGYDDDIDPFPILSYISTTQGRAIIQAVGFKATFGQFGAMIITDTNYTE